MNTYEVSRRGQAEIAARAAISCFLLAAIFFIPLRHAGYPGIESTIAGVMLTALFAFFVVQWFQVAHGKWQIIFSETTVELPSIGKTEIESIEAVRRFWRGPGQHCLVVKLRKGAGKLLSPTATIFPQYYERGPELEARIKDLAKQG